MASVCRATLGADAFVHNDQFVMKRVQPPRSAFSPLPALCNSTLLARAALLLPIMEARPIRSSTSRQSGPLTADGTQVRRDGHEFLVAPGRRVCARARRRAPRVRDGVVRPGRRARGQRHHLHPAGLSPPARTRAHTHARAPSFARTPVDGAARARRPSLRRRARTTGRRLGPPPSASCASTAQTL